MKHFFLALSIAISCTLVCTDTTAQINKKSISFNFESSNDPAANGYGEIKFTASNDLVIGFIAGFGENVKSLNLQVNDGFTYKLAPAQQGMNLNYVGSGLQIAVKKGDRILVSFTNGGKGDAVKHVLLTATASE